jgi:hypothetical protein
VLGLNPGLLFSRNVRAGGGARTLIEDAGDYPVRCLLQAGMSVHLRLGDALFRLMPIAWNILLGQSGRCWTRRAARTCRPIGIAESFRPTPPIPGGASRADARPRFLRVKNSYAEHAKAPSYAETASRSDVSTHTAQALPADAGRAAAAARGRGRWSFRMQARG